MAPWYRVGMRHIGGMVWIAVVASCGGSAATAYPPSWVGSDEARRTAMTAEEGDSPLPPESLADEATLAYADGQTACFDVTVRSLARSDAPLTGLRPTCRAATADGPVTAPAEASSVAMVSVYDYADNGDLVSTVAEEVVADSYDPAGVEPPAEGLHRVAERHARLCCAVPASEELVLSLGEIELSWPMR